MATPTAYKPEEEVQKQAKKRTELKAVKPTRTLYAYGPNLIHEQISATGFQGSFTYTPNGTSVTQSVAQGTFFRLANRTGQFSVNDGSRDYAVSQIVFDAATGMTYGRLANGKYVEFQSNNSNGEPNLRFNYALNGENIRVSLVMNVTQGSFTYTPTGRSSSETMNCLGYVSIKPDIYSSQTFITDYNELRDRYLSNEVRYAIMPDSSTRAVAKLNLDGKWHGAHDQPAITLFDSSDNQNMLYTIVIGGVVNTRP